MVYFGLPFRQTEGMIRAYCNRIPAVPDFTSIHKRVNWNGSVKFVGVFSSC